MRQVLVAAGVFWLLAAQAPPREYGAFDEEAIAVVDKCRAGNAMNYQGNPSGL